MKNLNLAFLIALTVTVSTQAQTRPTTETTYALSGPVHTLRTEAATFVKKDGQYVEGPRVLQMTATFNEDGNRTDFGMYDEKGALTRRIVERFDGQRLMEFLNYDGAGRMWLRGTNVYDEYGQIKEKATYNGDGSLRSKTVLKRNDQGQLVELAEHSANGILLQKISNTFNGKSLRTIERYLYRTDGSLQSKEIQDVPQKHSEIITYKPEGSVDARRVRENEAITEYAQDGSLQKTTIISSQGRLQDQVMVKKDGTSKRESEIPDQIDAHGNWIKQTKWITDSNGTRPLEVTYRAITYYEK